MRRVLAGAAAALAALGLAAAALGADAQTRTPRQGADPILGAWRFETETYSPGCKITGDMTIRPTKEKDRFTCTFVARERCGREVDIVAEQTCAITRSGKELSISSTIVKVAPAVGYAPDDWELTFINASKMTGELRSAAVAPVTFFRAQTPIS
jgi:hypothetical protein